MDEQLIKMKKTLEKVLTAYTLSCIVILLFKVLSVQPLIHGQATDVLISACNFHN